MPEYCRLEPRAAFRGVLSHVRRVQPCLGGVPSSHPYSVLAPQHNTRHPQGPLGGCRATTGQLAAMDTTHQHTSGRARDHGDRPRPPATPGEQPASTSGAGLAPNQCVLAPLLPPEPLAVCYTSRTTEIPPPPPPQTPHPLGRRDRPNTVAAAPDTILSAPPPRSTRGPCCRGHVASTAA